MIEVENIHIQAVSQEESGRISVGEIKIDPNTKNRIRPQRRSESVWLMYIR